jgi:hypothetical protein
MAAFRTSGTSRIFGFSDFLYRYREAFSVDSWLITHDLLKVETRKKNEILRPFDDYTLYNSDYLRAMYALLMHLFVTHPVMDIRILLIFLLHATVLMEDIFFKFTDCL